MKFIGWDPGRMYDKIYTNTDDNTKVSVGTGVPTEEYFDKNNTLIEFEKEVSKRYTVKFNYKL